MIFHNNILSKTLFMIMLLHKRCGGGILLKDINFLEIKRATLSHAYSATINKRNSSFKIFATSKIPSFCSRICLCCALFHIYDSFFLQRWYHCENIIPLCSRLLFLKENIYCYVVASYLKMLVMWNEKLFTIFLYELKKILFITAANNFKLSEKIKFKGMKNFPTICVITCKKKSSHL